MVAKKETVSAPKPGRDDLRAENENLQRIIEKGMKANKVLEAKNKELMEKLAAAGGEVFDDSDYEKCPYFIDKQGRKHKATTVLRQLARHRGLRPCSPPVSKKA